MSKRTFLYLVALVTILFSILYVRSRFLLVELSYKLVKEQSVRKDLERQKQELVLELAVLKSPARVETIAMQRLELRRPKAGELTVTLGEEP